MVALSVAALLTALWLYLVGSRALRIAWVQFTKSVEPKGIQGQPGQPMRHPLPQLLLIEPFTTILERLGIFHNFPILLNSYHTKLLLLKEEAWTMERTKSEVGMAIGIGYTALISCAWLSVLAQELLLLFVGVILSAVLAIRPIVEAGQLVDHRKQQIAVKLSDMLSKLALLIGAGETVQTALVRCLEGKSSEDHPLYKEWSAMVSLLRNGQSFSTTIESFNRRCAVQEVSVFTTVLLLNYRRGGEHFVLALRELTYTLWEKRKAIVRSEGEKASSKLIFPLVGILFVLMILVAAPAVMLMS